MLAIRLDLAEDRKTLQLRLSPSTHPETMTAEDLTYLIRHLAWARASMEPSASVMITDADSNLRPSELPRTPAPGY
jgi:hypothetical protein